MSGNAKIDFDEQGDSLPEPKLMVLWDTLHAFHKLGDIGRPDSDRVEFIMVGSVKSDFLVGNFVEGYGFVNVHFPRTACSAPTDAEKGWLEGRGVGIGPFPGTVAPKRGGL